MNVCQSNHSVNILSKFKSSFMRTIHGQNSSFSMFVGCFYLAPGSPILQLHELGKSLEEIIQISKNHTIILGGDFNLPGIDWDLWSVKSGARDPHHCQLLFDTMQDYHLHQLVDKPTRTTRTTSNILDLLFTSKPSLAQTVDIIPGLSDHDIVTTKLLYKAYINKSKPREVFAFSVETLRTLFMIVQINLRISSPP